LERRHGQGVVGILHFMNIALLASVLAFSMALPLIPASRAATTVDVNIVNFDFQLADVTIQPGDTVRWTNTVVTIHSVVNDVGSGETFSSSDMGLNDVFTHAFNTAGDFSYHCGHHPSMQGTVHVSTLVPEFSSLPIVMLGLVVLVAALSAFFRKG
jgi:plastocyanin